MPKVVSLSRQVSWELHKLARQRWVWLGPAFAVLLELVLVSLLALSQVRDTVRRLLFEVGIGFEANFSGLTVGAFLLNHTSAEIGSLFVILTGSCLLGQELEDGSLRMALCRPVSRARIFYVKWLALVAFVIAINLFIGLTSLGIGLLARPAGNLLFWSFKEGVFGIIPFHPGLGRFALAVALLTLSQLTLAALAFFFSCFRLRPAVASIATLTVLFTDDLVRFQAAPRSWKPWFLMSHLTGWMRAFQESVPWRDLTALYIPLSGLTVILLIAAYLRWRKLDLIRY